MDNAKTQCTRNVASSSELKLYALHLVSTSTTNLMNCTEIE